MQISYTNSLQKINISNTFTERIILKRLADDVVMVCVEEDFTGTITKLAYYIPETKRWVGYNPHNLNKWFKLLREHKYISPKVIRFLTPELKDKDRVIIEKTLTCFKRRVTINVEKLSMATKREVNNMISEVAGLLN